MQIVGDGRDHIYCRWKAERERRVRRARLPQGSTGNINYDSTLLIISDMDSTILAFPMSARGVLAFAWLRR